VKSIHGPEAANEMTSAGRVVLIDAEGEFYYPDNPEDEALMRRAHGAVRVVGAVCRCVVCCCRPGEGHRSAG
jgi:hypothetical protein